MTYIYREGRSNSQHAGWYPQPLEESWSCENQVFRSADTWYGCYLLPSWGMKFRLKLVHVNFEISELFSSIPYLILASSYCVRTNLEARLYTATLIFFFCIAVDIITQVIDQQFPWCCGSHMNQYFPSLWRMLPMAWHLKKQKKWEAEDWILRH